MQPKSQSLSVDEVRMVFSLPVLSCESSVSVRENSDRKNDELLNIGWSKLCRRQPLRSWNRYDLFNQILKQDLWSVQAACKHIL